MRVPVPARRTSRLAVPGGANAGAAQFISNMPLIEGCKHSLEISVPAQEVDEETERVISELQKKVKIPGFRPGKVPAGMIKTKFHAEIKKDVLEHLVPKYFRKQLEQENLNMVGTPEISDVHFEKGEPLRFKASFEVAPEVELKEYTDITIPYRDPEITEEDIAKRLEELRDQKAEYVNVDPRPAADGDYAVVSLDSASGTEGEPIHRDEIMFCIGAAETLPAFSDNLRGMSPGEEKEFEVTYPEDYGGEKLAGKTVAFRASLKVIRRKELPELNDEFARDLGDYKDLEELREQVRKSLFFERQAIARRDATEKLVDKLVASHDFPVPEAYLERQIEIQVERRVHELIDSGVDPRSIHLDWEKLKATQREKAVRDVKASLLLERISDRESIVTTSEEVDREVQRIAKQEREPVAAVRAKLEKEGALRRIAGQIRADKTLNFLFEHARKEAE